MRANYLIRRVLFFLLLVWVGATINFFLPRLSGKDPIVQRLMELAAMGGANQAGFDEIVRVYNEKFGLDKPLFVQYLNYLWDILHFELNYSTSAYPLRVIEVIGDALPYSIGLMGVTVVLSWLTGTLLGAFLGWPKSPRFVHWLFPPLIALRAVPYYLLGLVLLYLIAFRLKVLPQSGAYTHTRIPEWSWSFAWDVLKHAILPSFSVILSQVGGWALTMRGMMVTTQGEDYMIFARGKGLKEGTRFYGYAVRNSILPQFTSLGLMAGYVISGSILVEVVFAYPGIGTILYRAVQLSDYFLLQGIVFLIILAVGVTTLLMDLIYPLLDPRISYGKEGQ